MVKMIKMKEMVRANRKYAHDNGENHENERNGARKLKIRAPY